MKKLTLQIEDAKGEVLTEEMIEISPGDKILLKVTTDIDNRAVARATEMVSKWLNGESEILAIPHYIDLRVVRVKED